MMTAPLMRSTVPPFSSFNSSPRLVTTATVRSHRLFQPVETGAEFGLMFSADLNLISTSTGVWRLAGIELRRLDEEPGRAGSW
jgi:hypothetical protein